MNVHKKPKDTYEFEEEILEIRRVTRVTQGGRQLRFRATVIIGDKHGRVGIGTAKANEVQGAIAKAIHAAKKSLIHVPLIGDTIPHTTRASFKSSQLILIPAGKGTGVIAGGSVRKVLELAGVKNVLSKIYGSTNKLNCAKVALQAIGAIRDRKVAYFV